jgi:serine/threonine protein kinase
MKKFCPICLTDLQTNDRDCPDCGTRLIHVDPDDLSGLTLDQKYEILERVAQGGMGVVYRARQVYLQREVALKVLRSDLPRDAVATKRFLLEVRSVSALRSAHTVTIHDFGISHDGRLYFAMEFLEGEGLDRRLERGPLPWRQATNIILQTCESLAEAHGKSIWHRDIKPANLFLTRAPTGGVHVKVLDFGIAKVADAPANLTAPGRGLGTPDFSSPEQIMGEKMDHRSDLYSLGVVFYEMLSGRRPYSGTGNDLLMRHIRDVPRRVEEACPEAELPKPIADIVMWMLEKLPGRRPQSAVALARRLLEAAHEVAPGESFALLQDDDTPPYLSPPEAEPEAAPTMPTPSPPGEPLTTGDLIPRDPGQPTQALTPPHRPPVWWWLGTALAAAVAVLLVWHPWVTPEPEPGFFYQEAPPRQDRPSPVPTLAADLVAPEPDAHDAPGANDPDVAAPPAIPDVLSSPDLPPEVTEAPSPDATLVDAPPRQAPPADAVTDTRPDAAPGDATPQAHETHLEDAGPMPAKDAVSSARPDGATPRPEKEPRKPQTLPTERKPETKETQGPAEKPAPPAEEPRKPVKEPAEPAWQTGDAGAGDYGTIREPGSGGNDRPKDDDDEYGLIPPGGE